jgi:hypothetical protein
MVEVFFTSLAPVLLLSPLLDWSPGRGQEKQRWMKSKGKGEKSCSSPTVHFLSLLSDSRVLGLKNIKFIKIMNLNGTWLRIGTASLLDFLHLNLSPLNLGFETGCLSNHRHVKTCRCNRSCPVKQFPFG